jgi:beta-1,2-mannobiose phosphorylase / 1,2-beta-oligomannan phosphorylase
MLHPLAVAEFHGKVVFFCAACLGKKTELFLYEKAREEFKEINSLQIFSEKGKRKQLKNCHNFHFFQCENIWYLTYSQKYTKLFKSKLRTIIAKSVDLVRFDIESKPEGEFPAEFAVVSRHLHRRNFLAYFGKSSIYVTASKNLEDWHVSGEMLKPRKGFFDDERLCFLDAVTTERGILVLYESKKNSETDRQIKLGAALFDLNQPYKISWRSNEPIWAKTLREKEHPLRYLGLIISHGVLHIYWVTNRNEIISEAIKPAAAGIGSLKKRPSHLSRHHSNPILEPNQENTWEYDATFNPAALHLENKIHLIYRAIGAGGVSVFGYASSKDGFKIDERLDSPAFAVISFQGNPQKSEVLLSPQYVSGGSWVGCEDPRLTQIGERIYMTYVSFDGCNPPGVALTSISVHDFLHKNWKWEPPMLISKAGEIQKNWMLFPEKINGKYVVLHSITPRIAVEYIDDIAQKGLVIQSGKKPGEDNHRWDNIVRGAGAPPIKTDYGWLVLYHAMDRKDPDKYKVGAMILDHDDPTKILYRAAHPVLEPAEAYENNGAKSGVVYVCGAVIKEDVLFVYYGGADSVVCVATANIHEFLRDIMREAITGM